MSHGDLSLIRTKLAPPRVGIAPVSREALLGQLEDGRDKRLTLLLGPAGCGKTMLLTQWRQQLLMQGARVAWYSAGTDDSDALTAAYLVESLVQAGLAIDKDALRVYLRSGARAWQPLVASLVDDLCAQDSQVYLVIDDLHHLSSFGSLKLLDHWLSMAPENFHLVLASRSQPPLQIARLRAQDQITELQYSDLRFSRDETHRFLQTQRLRELSAAQENMLYQMTDGWAAGLQLLAFSLRKEKNPEQFFRREGRLSLSSADVLEKYLESTVVQHLPESELGFLVAISSCRRFNRELCQLLTGDPRAAEQLARFESENLFLIPIDTSDAEPWYRFHRLFADFLKRRLQRLGEAEVRRIHHLASRWFAGAGLHVEAMRHASLAGDPDFVVQLIDRAARRMINGANFVELLKWCDAVPPESLRSHLNVCLCAAWAQLSCSRLEDFRRNMGWIAQHPDYCRPEVEMEVRLLHAFHFLQQDDTAGCLRIVEPMLQESPPVKTFNSLLLYKLSSSSLVHAGEFQRARDVARLRHRIETRERPDYPRPLVDIVSGFSHLMQGNIHVAADALRSYIDDALQRSAHGVDAAGLYSGYLLEALYQSGAVQEAQGFLDQYLDLIDAVGYTDSLLFAYLVRARLQRLQGNPLGARETLLRLEEIGCRKRIDRLVAWSLQEQIALSLHQGRTVPVDDLQQQLDHVAAPYLGAQNCAWAEIGLAALLARAMIAFSTGRVGTCLEALAAAEEAALRNRRTLLATRLGLMRAISLLRDSQNSAGMALGRRMVAIAAESGMMRILPDLGSAALLLAEPLLQSGPQGAVRQLLQAAVSELGSVPGGAPLAQSTARPAAKILSGRESEIIGLLGRGLAIKSVARTLSVSSGTVKWHIKNIYNKLDAPSREGALAKARELRILS